jgi:hypothetical protein
MYSGRIAVVRKVTHPKERTSAGLKKAGKGQGVVLVADLKQWIRKSYQFAESLYKDG